jgi:hypothetical protein
VTLAHTYLPTVDDIGAGGASASAPTQVTSFQQYDAIVGYDFAHSPVHGLGKLKMRVGMNNVFNAMPPVAESAFPATNADVGDNDGPIGRLFFVDATYRY